MDNIDQENLPKGTIEHDLEKTATSENSPFIRTAV